MAVDEFQPFSGNLNNDTPEKNPDDVSAQPVARQLGHEAIKEDEGVSPTPEQELPVDTQNKERYEVVIRKLEEILDSDTSMRSLVNEVENWRGRPVNPGEVQDVIGRLTHFLEERAQKAYDASREFGNQSSYMETDIRRENIEGDENLARTYIKAYDELRRGTASGTMTIANQTPDALQAAHSVANGDINWLNRLVELLRQQESAASAIRSAIEQAKIYVK